MLCFALLCTFLRTAVFAEIIGHQILIQTQISYARGCLLVKMAFKTVIRPIVRSCRISAMSRKTGPGIIGILLHCRQSLSKKGKQTLLFSKNMLEFKQFKNMAFTGSNSYWCVSKSVENKLDEQTVRGNQRQSFRKVSVRKTIEILNFRNICCKISCLPAPPGIFRTSKKWYNCPFLIDFYPKKVT